MLPCDPYEPKKAKLRITSGSSKICIMCKEEKDLKQFAIHRAKGCKNPLSPYCKECAGIRAILYKHRITVQKYREILAVSGGVCTICKNPPSKGRKLDVDHNHATGEVRGLLCRRCNLALGYLESSNLSELKAYVIQYGGVRFWEVNNQ